MRGWVRGLGGIKKQCKGIVKESLNQRFGYPIIIDPFTVLQTEAGTGTNEGFVAIKSLLVAIKSCFFIARAGGNSSSW